ncbi:hypothetical protein AB0L67_38720 [Streptomyces flaveolus]|uniref:hypothetical protein n=1 Tax=Streptomyces flaveolus TaxID=67297 RepID=UPI00341FC79B
MRIRHALVTATLGTVLAAGTLAVPAEATGQLSAPLSTTVSDSANTTTGAAGFPDYEFWTKSKGAYLRTNYFGTADPVRWSPKGEDLWVHSRDTNSYRNKWYWVEDAWGTSAWIYCDNVTPGSCV